MARTGRPKKPAQIHLLHGTWRADRHNDAEPQPARIAPRCPRHVQGEARREWRRKTRELLPMGVLSLADRAPLERYCLWYAIGHETLEKLNTAEEAKIHTTQSGYRMLNPLIALWKQACEMMDKFDTEFGCTAASRTRIRIEKPKEVDQFEIYRNLRSRPKRA